MDYYIGIDLGGTNTPGGIVDESGRILVKDFFPTKAPRPAEEIAEDIAVLCERLRRKAGLKREQIRRVGVGAPGVMHDGIIEYARNLQFFDVPFAEMLREKTNRPVYLLNDANAAAYGEFLAGAGKGENCHSLFMMTIGTGIGGGVIINDRIYDGFNGASAELGHVVINAGGELCTCGKHGCFDLYCSATALKKSAVRAMEEHPESLMWKVCGGDLEKVDGRTSFEAKKLGDPVAAQVIDTFVRYLSLGVANLISLFQPEIFCIGGGISAAGDGVMEPLTNYVVTQSYIKDEKRRTRIVAAQLGNDAGIIGAALAGIR